MCGDHLGTWEPVIPPVTRPSARSLAAGSILNHPCVGLPLGAELFTVLGGAKAAKIIRQGNADAQSVNVAKVHPVSTVVTNGLNMTVQGTNGSQREGSNDFHLRLLVRMSWLKLLLPGTHEHMSDRACINHKSQTSASSANDTTQKARSILITKYGGFSK